jgi:F-type H+-transporting ATPase subunit alpha
LEFLEAQRPTIMADLRTKKAIDEKLDQELRKAIEDFLKTFKP